MISGEYVLADMLPEPSNHDDIVHFKNDLLGPPNISSENHALSASSIETQPIPASKKDTNNMDALYKKMVKKSTKILDEKKKCYPENNLPIS
ncbi:2512_t:CDS:2 [Rhizophagus irregularis]|nr:2512_t:CDS:2 [Rhizophagus irregularis]